MICIPRLLAAALTGAAVVLPALPVSAQWVASGRWGSEDRWRYVTPGSWQVLRSDHEAHPVSIHAEGENHLGRIAIWCRPDSGESMLQFDAYRGDALHQPLAVSATASPPADRVTLVIGEQRFERALQYDPAQRVWTARDMLDEAFLQAFAWGSRMQMLNAQGAEITSFRLNGSGAAVSALNAACQE
ncbi:hypothetical protein [Pararhodobacter oceanensis]|uniref:hypothetical protein n=1 Tax=Pararhodobacter oceanensis TaxID=2172121 RepID=UPI003A92E51D